MTISRRVHPYAEEVPEGKRLRMKDWLKSRIGDPRYPGLVWTDEKKNIFRIPWKHAALHGWDQNSDGALFRDWAEHTGACVKNAHPKTLKATFRCALHSLPDVHEVKTMAKKRGDDACRVYQFDDPSTHQPTKRRLIRIRNHNKDKKHGPIERWTPRENVPPSGSRSSAVTVKTCVLPPYAEQPQFYESWVPYPGPQFISSNMNTGKCDQNMFRRSSLGKMTHPAGSESLYQPQRFTYATQSNPDIPHSLLPPMVNHWVERPTYIDDNTTFTPSYSVPEYPSFANPDYVYSTPGEVHPAFHAPAPIAAPGGNFNFPKLETRQEYDMYLSGTDAGSSSMSPGTSGYSPSHSSMTSSPTPLSPMAHPGSLTPLSQQRLSTVAEAVASATAVIDSYQSCIPNDLTKESSQMQTSIYEDRFIDSVDALIASGAIQIPFSKHNEMFCGSPPPLQEGSSPPEYGTQTFSTKNFFTPPDSDPLNLSFKDFPQASSVDESTLESHLREICSSSFLGDSERTHHILATVSNEILPPEQIIPRSQVVTAEGFPPAPHMREDDLRLSSSQWFPSPAQQEASLPSASTLLSPSHSPSYKKKEPLRWISASSASPEPDNSPLRSPQLPQLALTDYAANMPQLSPSANPNLSTIACTMPSSFPALRNLPAIQYPGIVTTASGPM